MTHRIIASPAGTRRPRVAYEAWRGLAPESQQSEWVDGEVIAFLPPLLRHQTIVVLLTQLVVRHG